MKKKEKSEMKLYACISEKMMMVIIKLFKSPTLRSIVFSVLIKTINYLKLTETN